MNITLMGYVLIPIGLLFLIFKPNNLLYFSVLFCGFSGSAIINVGENGFSIQPSYWFGMLWLFYLAIRKNFVYRVSNVRRRQVLLYAFVIYCVASLIFPLFFEGKVYVENVDGVYELLRFRGTNITQTLYLIFCFLFYLGLLTYVNPNKELKNGVAKYYVYGLIFTCVVTTYQVIALRYSFPFDEIFRQCVHGNVQGNRIYGPCIEASMLAYYLVASLPITVRLANPVLKYGLCLWILAIGIYSYSSSFVLGAVLWVVMELIMAIKQRKVRIRKYTLYGLIALFVVGVFASIYLNDYIAYAFKKLFDTINGRNISGTNRSANFLSLMGTFSFSPLFGVGFGSARGTDLLSTWLACVGLFGTLLIFLYIIDSLIKSKAHKSVKMSVIIVWSVMLVSVPEPYNLFVWVLMAHLSFGNSCFLNIGGKELRNEI